MNISNLIEAYIKELMEEEEYVEMKRSDIANKFNCVPSQINYVISTRFIPELGFYVESRRGGGGYIKIQKIELENNKYISNIFENMGSNLSQSVADIYLQNMLLYNIIDNREETLIRAAISDKSLVNVSAIKKDKVRADIFKNLIINIIR